MDKLTARHYKSTNGNGGLDAAIKASGSYKMTKRRVNKILGYLRDGNFRIEAAQASGISGPTFYKWMDIPAFAEAVEIAEAEGEIKLVAITRKEKNGARWVLGRRWRDRWGDRQEIEVSTKGPIVLAWPEDAGA